MERTSSKPLKIAVVGVQTTRVSGTSMNLRNLLLQLERREDVALTMVNTESTYGGVWGQVHRILRVIWQTWRAARHVDVVTFHMSEPPKGLPIWLLTRLAGKPFLVRWFDGANYRHHGGLVRRVSASFMLRHADVNLFQTKQLVREGLEDGAKRAFWFSNLRELPSEAEELAAQGGPCRRFIFLGHIREYKGIRELVEAAERFDGEIEIDAYGPLFDDLESDILEGRRNIRHRGELEGSAVVEKIREYDALVLPTKAKTEGYPGVVIEAYMAGRPVVTTYCGGIPEIVDETSGILVEPGDVDALHGALKQLSEDEALYRRLRAGAVKKRALFSSEKWADYFVEVCRALARRDADGIREIEFQES